MKGIVKTVHLPSVVQSELYEATRIIFVCRENKNNDFIQQFVSFAIYCIYKAYIYTAGKISIEHVTIFLSKYIPKSAVDMKFSPGVGNNPSNPYIQWKQNK